MEPKSYQTQRAEARSAKTRTWELMPADTPVKYLFWLYVLSSRNGCYEALPKIAEKMGTTYKEVWRILNKYLSTGEMRYEVIKDEYGNSRKALFCKCTQRASQEEVELLQEKPPATAARTHDVVPRAETRQPVAKDAADTSRAHAHIRSSVAFWADKWHEYCEEDSLVMSVPMVERSTAILRGLLGNTLVVQGLASLYAAGDSEGATNFLIEVAAQVAALPGYANAPNNPGGALCAGIKLITPALPSTDSGADEEKAGEPICSHKLSDEGYHWTAEGRATPRDKNGKNIDGLVMWCKKCSAHFGVLGPSEIYANGEWHPYPAGLTRHQYIEKLKTTPHVFGKSEVVGGFQD